MIDNHNTKSFAMTASGTTVRRVTLAGLAVNLVLAAAKFGAGIMGQSHALVADAIHSLTDTITDVAVLVGSYYWSKPADTNHPYGHQRIETLVTIFVGILLAVAGLGIVYEAVMSMVEGNTMRPSGLALGAAFASIVVKEVLYQWTRAVGDKLRSSALKANAWHHRTDALSSIPVVAAIAGAMIFPSFFYFDALGAILVSIFIFHAAFGILQPGLSELVDSSACGDTCEKISQAALSVDGVREVHGLRSRMSGNYLQVDLHVIVDGELTVQEGHHIAEKVKRVIFAEANDVIDAVIHIEPPEEQVGHNGDPGGKE